MDHGRPDPEVSFQGVTTDDLALLGRWFAAPHVHRWWFQGSSPAEVEADFGPALRGEEPCENLLAIVAGRPVGLSQRYRWQDYPEDVERVGPEVDLPAGATSVDYLLGEVADTGRGLGPRVLAALVADTWLAYPTCPAIVVPVAAGNRPSWRALEKVGFGRVAVVRMEPDNPVDPPEHVVMRIDRPQR